MMRNSIIRVLLIGAVMILSYNCGDGNETKPQTQVASNTIKKTNLNVPAELGGAGFENLAEKMGYETYNIQPGEEIFFGRHTFSFLILSTKLCLFTLYSPQ